MSMATLDYYLRKAIRYCGGTQKDLARRIGVKPGKISYLLNYARKINMKDAVKIELAVEGTIKWYQLMEFEYIQIKQAWKDSVANAIHLISNKASFSEKIKQAMEYERDLGLRQGKRTDLTLRENSHEVSGRTDEIVVKLFDIGSAWTYRQAKKVILKGCPELIQAMDAGLAVYLAAGLTRYPPEKQRWILSLSKKEVIAYAKGKIRS